MQHNLVGRNRSGLNKIFTILGENLVCIQSHAFNGNRMFYSKLIIGVIPNVGSIS